MAAVKVKDRCIETYDGFVAICEEFAEIIGSDMRPIYIHYPKDQEDGGKQNIWEAYFHDQVLDYLMMETKEVKNGMHRGGRYGLYIHYAIDKDLFVFGFNVVHSVEFALTISQSKGFFDDVIETMKLCHQYEIPFFLNYANKSMNQNSESKSVQLRSVSNFDPITQQIRDYDPEVIRNDYPAVVKCTGKQNLGTEGYFARSSYFIFEIVIPNDDNIFQNKKDSPATMTYIYMTALNVFKLHAHGYGKLIKDPYKGRNQNARRSLLTSEEPTVCSMEGCEMTEGLEAAHIVPYSKGGSDHPSNLLWLCSKCHKKFDKNLGAEITFDGKNKKILKNKNVVSFKSKATSRIFRLRSKSDK